MCIRDSTYTFKIDVNEGDYYKSVDSISAPEWEFVISKAQAPSSKPDVYKRQAIHRSLLPLRRQQKTANRFPYW